MTGWSSEVYPEDTVHGVATGTAVVALELAHRYGCVAGVDLRNRLAVETRP